MEYKEINIYDIKHNSLKVNCIVTDNAHHFLNDLYILIEGNHFELDSETRKALKSLMEKIKKVLDN